MSCDRAKEILKFWFGAPEDPDFGKERNIWWSSTPELDQKIKDNFESDLENAKNGAYDSWKDDPELCLAMIILFDQFPRNIYRKTTKSFETDGLAIALAKSAVERKFLEVVIQKNPKYAMFMAMPYQHAEDLETQKLSVEIFTSLKDEDYIDYARQHYDLIAKYGRFPHRNAILGRPSTDEELGLLKDWSAF